MMKSRLLLSVSLLAFANPAYATLQEAMDALKENDTVFAIEEFTRLMTDEKDQEARYQLGRMYEEGYGVGKNEMTALSLYKEAAEGGNEKAALKVGNAYYLGKGVEKNYADALNWYKIAAENGSYAAQYNIGLMFEEGTGVKKNPVIAFDFYKKSGEQGYGPAQYALGKMFLSGVGTPQDFTAALKWHKLAADQGDHKAQMDLAKLFSNTSLRGLPFNMVGAHMYYNIVSAFGPSPQREEAATLRNEVTAKMRPEEVQEAQRRAQRWKKKSRTESIPSLQDTTGLEEELGISKTKKTREQIEAQQIKLTVKTDRESMVVAAGVGRRDLSSAVRQNNFKPVLDILVPKADSGDIIAMLALGDLYTLGQGMDLNPQEALKWYSKAAEANNPIAFFKLGPMYCEGDAVEPDLAKCYMYFLLAKKYADQDSLPAVEETIKMLDENFDPEIRQAAVQMAEDYGKIANNDNVKPKKGLLSGFKQKLFNKDEEETNEIITPTEKSKEPTSADDFFADM